MMNQQSEEMPHSVRNHRPRTGVINLGLMTPFSFLQENNIGASHEVATEDKNSLGVPYARHGDILSSDQISKISNSMRPESGSRRRPRRVAAN